MFYYNLFCVDNHAWLGGGVGGFSVALTGCTIAQNSASEGGGVYVAYLPQSETLQTLVNCIVATNTAAISGPDIGGTAWNYGPPRATYCLIPGGYVGTGNLSGSPRFVDAIHGDFRLLANSPGVDAGNVAATS